MYYIVILFLDCVLHNVSSRTRIFFTDMRPSFWRHVYDIVEYGKHIGMGCAENVSAKAGWSFDNLQMF